MTGTFPVIYRYSKWYGSAVSSSDLFTPNILV